LEAQTRQNQKRDELQLCLELARDMKREIGVSGGAHLALCAISRAVDQAETDQEFATQLVSTFTAVSRAALGSANHPAHVCNLIDLELDDRRERYANEGASTPGFNNRATELDDWLSKVRKHLGVVSEETG
jgi:hypothetical protein